MEERKVHSLFDDAMASIQESLGEMNNRRRFLFVLAEVQGQDVKISKTTWNFPVGKYGQVMRKLREMLLDDVIPPMPDELPLADSEDLLELGVVSPEELGVDVPTSPDAEEGVPDAVT